MNNIFCQNHVSSMKNPKSRFGLSIIVRFCVDSLFQFTTWIWIVTYIQLQMRKQFISGYIEWLIGINCSIWHQYFLCIVYPSAHLLEDALVQSVSQWMAVGNRSSFLFFFNLRRTFLCCHSMWHVLCEAFSKTIFRINNWKEHFMLSAAF